LLHVYNSAATSRLIVGPNGIGAATPNALALEQENTGFTVCHVRNLYNNGGLGELRLGGYGFTTFTSGSSQTERARIDSSGRLLVGTSSAPTGARSQYSKFSVYLNNQSTSAGGQLNLVGGARGLLSTGNSLGQLIFTDSTDGEYGKITCDLDGTPGSGDYPGRLVFSTTADGAASPTERMRILNNGTTDLRATTDVFNVLSNAAAGTTNLLIRGGNSATSFTAYIIPFGVYTNGNVVNTNNSYAGISDLKLKENIVDASSQWNDLKALQVRNYNFKEGQTHTQIGLIAQEVELVSPGLVSESPDRDEDGNDLGTVTKSVNYSVLYMKAVKALQEAMERIEVLEAKVNTLEDD
jgi:hypothetical protein